MQEVVNAVEHQEWNYKEKIFKLEQLSNNTSGFHNFLLVHWIGKLWFFKDPLIHLLWMYKMLLSMQ